MSLIWVVIYQDEFLCASKSRDHIVEYLFYKDVKYIGLGSGFEIAREKASFWKDGIIPEIYLQRHRETGYLCTPEDVQAYDEWKCVRVDSYNNAIKGLEKAIELLDMAEKKKDKKKLEKALNVLTKRKSLFIGKKADMDTMERIVKVDPATVIEERNLFRDFMYKVQNSE